MYNSIASNDILNNFVPFNINDDSICVLHVYCVPNVNAYTIESHENGPWAVHLTFDLA